MTTRNDIAELIFPDVKETIQDLEKKFPPRKNPTRLPSTAGKPDGQVCSRVAPSPTGFLHIGVIFASFVPRKFANQNKGTFILRIEDTDQKRLVEGGTDQIIGLLKRFGITIDEGPLGAGNADIGEYGPYIQSKRKYFYEVFAKTLIAQGKAYPCRMTEQELEAIREQQTKSKVTPGIYGNYSLWRNKTPDEILEKINTDKNFIIRFRSPGDMTKRIVFDDVIKGKLTMNDNYNDIILIKSDGLPTYHLAHIVDDYLMRVSHVIRAEEWLMSVPLHLQLFQACGLQAPRYCHVAQILKLDDGKKRKLSKRKDPEANVEFFFQKGFPNHGIIDYILTIVDPFFEERQKNNPEKDYHDYEINLEKMSKSGALFDIAKMESVSNAYLSRISTQQLYAESLERAKIYKPDLATLMASDPTYAQAALGIERHTPKDPKRFTTYADIEPQLRFFFDSERERLRSEVKPIVLSTSVDVSDVMKNFVAEYITVLDLTMNVEDWFAQLKEIGKKYGFASNNAEFKAGGYIGKIGDVAMFLRIQLCCATQTPDLYSVMQVMGKERVVKRLQKINNT